MKGTTLSNHVAALHEAIETLREDPEVVRWHYIQVAFGACGENVSLTARRLGMHRRTLQRILAAKPPRQRGDR